MEPLMPDLVNSYRHIYFLSFIVKTYNVKKYFVLYSSKISNLQPYISLYYGVFSHFMTQMSDGVKKNLCYSVYTNYQSNYILFERNIQ